MTKVEIQDERGGSVDLTPVDSESISLWNLFEARKPVYQAKVKGNFRRLKWIIMAVLLGFYYLLPWVRWERGVGAPDQAILVDTINRKFYFFFIELWPQEVFYFTGLLLLAALGLFFATSLFGRVWCGYACPQTVWTDLFLTVERFFEGDRNAQIKLAKAPWSFGKVRKKLGKHITWLLIGLATGGAWVFYFQDAPTLWRDMLKGDFYFIPTFWMIFLTFSTYLMAGFAREQVCTYMCPYARFQGAMFDEESLIVTYDKARGEPRGNSPEAGDCVDCRRCVVVCPVGIDIRDGQQYRCINCALCVDACNSVMDKLERPRGLIRYNNLAGTIPCGKATFADVWQHARFVRPRTVIYGIIMATVAGVMLWALMTKSPMDMSVVHYRNPMFVALSDGSVRNTYTVRLINKSWTAKTYYLRMDHADVTLRTAQVTAPAGGALPLAVKAGKVAEYTVFAERPRYITDTGEMYPSHMAVTLSVTDDEGHADSYETVFIGPNEE
ncbi:MAG: cytochrome c oxidase accessory protein CcoG [Blastochloris viridis]|uniref:Cytochrome c oxidase accessory protein CcoG n=1 Tax=Blastochloris viridis TaxID=1079 RepID=A0A6N4QZ14_BLAVI|nr:MAG: cytochrome c oxidase accessory protein CcoG [Blastochloris viridis]